MTIALIDGDIVAYRCAAVNEKSPDQGLSLWQADQLLSRIIEDTNATDWKVYLSGENNFRYSIYPEYKANRRDQPRPRYLEHVREHLILEWDASICDGYEADDAMGIFTTENPEAIVCSIDKDLLQIAGTHYNFVQRKVVSVSEWDGAKWFYTQLLTGDTADNIKGCPGIGKVKAEKALEYCDSIQSMYDTCCTLYRLSFEKTDVDWKKELVMNANCLYIWRKENDKWIEPHTPEGEVQPVSS